MKFVKFENKKRSTCNDTYIKTKKEKHKNNKNFVSSRDKSLEFCFSDSFQEASWRLQAVAFHVVSW